LFKKNQVTMMIFGAEIGAQRCTVGYSALLAR
jgi:hypothetical protein